jgi:UDP-glucose 4-epimerase
VFFIIIVILLVDLFIRKAPACNIATLIKGVALILEKENVNPKIIGTRHGEKMYESLLSSEENAKCEDLGEYFKVPIDDRTLNYKIYFEEGHESLEPPSAYTSNSTQQLGAQEVADLISNLPEFKKHMKAI